MKEIGIFDRDRENGIDKEGKGSNRALTNNKRNNFSYFCILKLDKVQKCGKKNS